MKPFHNLRPHEGWSETPPTTDASASARTSDPTRVGLKLGRRFPTTPSNSFLRPHEGWSETRTNRSYNRAITSSDPTRVGLKHDRSQHTLEREQSSDPTRVGLKPGGCHLGWCSHFLRPHEGWSETRACRCRRRRRRASDPTRVGLKPVLVEQRPR